MERLGLQSSFIFLTILNMIFKIVLLRLSVVYTINIDLSGTPSISMNFDWSHTNGWWKPLEFGIR